MSKLLEPVVVLKLKQSGSQYFVSTFSIYSRQVSLNVIWNLTPFPSTNKSCNLFLTRVLVILNWIAEYLKFNTSTAKLCK